MKLTDKIRQSFAMQLVVFLFAFCLAIFVLIFVVNTYISRKVMFRTAEQIAHSMTKESSGKIQNILGGIETSADNLAFLVGSGILETNQINVYVKELLRNKHEIVALSINFTPQYLARNSLARSMITYHWNGTYQDADISSLSGQYDQQNWFSIPVKKRIQYWSEPWKAGSLNQLPVTSFSTPVMQGNDVIGVIRVDISLKQFQEIVSSIRLGQTGYAFLITNNGTIITHPADSLILNYTIFSYAEKIGKHKLSDIGREMIRGKSGFQKLPSSNSYPARWIYYAPVELNGWSIAIKFRDAEIMSEVNLVNFIFSIILIISLVLLLAMIYTRIRSIFKPLDALVKATADIGGGDFNVKLPPNEVKNEISVLTDSFSKMQSELKSYMSNLVQTDREKDKIKAEIKVAAQIQQAITPSHRHLLPNISEIDVYGVLEPAEDIGGDFYDAFMIDDRFICFAIADVFGKGIVASMLMTMVQTMIRTQSRYSNSAVSLVREINSYLCNNNKQANFITTIIGILDVETGIVEYCNAGHMPIYQRKANHICVRFGETHCTALGIFEHMKIESSNLKMDENDCLIMFTDGINEAMSKDEQFFGLERIEKVISELQHTTPESFAHALISEARKFMANMTQTDDLSVLVIKLNKRKR